MRTLLQQILGRREVKPRVSDEKIAARLDTAKQKVVEAVNAYADTVQELLSLSDEITSRGGSDARRSKKPDAST